MCDSTVCKWNEQNTLCLLYRARQILREFADDETRLSHSGSRGTTLTPVCPLDYFLKKFLLKFVTQYLCTV